MQNEVQVVNGSMRLVHGPKDLAAVGVSQCLESPPASEEERKHRPEAEPERFDLFAV
jgi:hypothetical protein